MASIEEELNMKFQDDRQKFVTNVIFTSAWMRNIVSNFLKPFGISQAQFNILRILRGNGDWMNMNDIKKVMVEKSPNTTRLVDKLLSNEYVERNRSEVDRRVVKVKISKKGLDLLKKLDKESQALSQMFIGNINNKEAGSASNVLDKMRG